MFLASAGLIVVVTGLTMTVPGIAQSAAVILGRWRSRLTTRLIR